MRVRLIERCPYCGHDTGFVAAHEPHKKLYCHSCSKYLRTAKKDQVPEMERLTDDMLVGEVRNLLISAHRKLDELLNDA